MVSMRGSSIRDGPRGATEQLTVAKRQLRDWVEPRLSELPRGDNGAVLERQLNTELGDAGLFCGEDPEDLGCLEEVRLHWSNQFLVLVTGVSIVCGFDESAYVYSPSDEGWRRVWQVEQNTYTENEYKPQKIEAVLISDYSQANDYVMLTLGTEQWCSSNWHRVYYRAFRLGPDPNAPALIDGEERAYLGDPPEIEGSVSRDEILVEFAGHSIDSGIIVRTVVRRFRIDGEEVRRVDPLALKPRDFVDEWLTHDWSEAVFWSESANRASLNENHERLHKERVYGEFIYPPMHCPLWPDLWQVGVALSEEKKPIGEEPDGTYFLVRWRPPYVFRMVAVGDRPWSECSEEDREAEDAPRTLFPVRDWR